MESDPFWSVNIKRSILSTFNLKLKKNSNGLNHPRFASLGRQQQQLLNQQPKGDNTQYFSVMEVSAILSKKMSNSIQAHLIKSLFFGRLID
jgi:hypothetical protein